MLEFTWRIIKAICLVFLLIGFTYLYGLLLATSGELIAGNTRDRLAAILYKADSGLIPSELIFDGKFYPEESFSLYKDRMTVKNRTNYDWIGIRLEDNKYTILAEALLLPAGATIEFTGCMNVKTFIVYAVSEHGNLVVHRKDIANGK